MSDRVPAEYIETFYLGEMTREESVELLREIIKQTSISLHEENIVEIIGKLGGLPVLLYNVVNYSVRYRLSINESLRYLENSVYEELIQKLRMIYKQVVSMKSIDVWSKIKSVLREVIDKPVDVLDIDIETLDVIDKLVEHNILQYGCRDYIGIYRWNRDRSGGICYLDIIAPSNRLYCKALENYLKKHLEEH
ncbi:MAG: hypothetical protein B6U89_05225 [Desulfurococcales archaeon ex4484_58]|nr:MAG: hypothetical protein B6U89_05225 [Desulfurococcales archaeon ex4484_58]